MQVRFYVSRFDNAEDALMNFSFGICGKRSLFDVKLFPVSSSFLSPDDFELLIASNFK